jgi:micrococcal nuclease
MASRYHRWSGGILCSHAERGNKETHAMSRRERAYYRSYRGFWLWLIVALVVLWRIYTAPQTPPGPEVLEEGVHVVQRVVDGDTLLLASGARVRLQGIDTPETVAEDRPVDEWGAEASQFTKDFIARAGGGLRLTFSLERRDRFDRFLAFAWNGDTLLNEELVRAGLAEARGDFRFSNTMKRRLVAAQEEAKRAGRGIWSASNEAPMTKHQ